MSKAITDLEQQTVRFQKYARCDALHQRRRRYDQYAAL